MMNKENEGFVNFGSVWSDKDSDEIYILCLVSADEECDDGTHEVSISMVNAITGNRYYVEPYKALLGDGMFVRKSYVREIQEDGMYFLANSVKEYYSGKE